MSIDRTIDLCSDIEDLIKSLIQDVSDLDERIKSQPRGTKNKKQIKRLSDLGVRLLEEGKKEDFEAVKWALYQIESNDEINSSDIISKLISQPEAADCFRSIERHRKKGTAYSDEKVRKLIPHLLSIISRYTGDRKEGLKKLQYFAQSIKTGNDKAMYEAEYGRGSSTYAAGAILSYCTWKEDSGKKNT